MGDLSTVPTVVVTGFGPFRNHMKNSSWLTVQELLKLDITDFRVIAKELPVEYETVAKAVPILWKEYNPKLVVHCGMSEQARCLTLEQIANNKDYHGLDIQGKLPLDHKCCDSGPDILCTGLDIQRVLDDVSSSGVCINAEASDNAGRYLCEFIYYISLKINKNTAFVHVPPVDQLHRAREMAETLAVIIRSMLKQIESCS